jgi:hypothetical protein
VTPTFNPEISVVSRLSNRPNALSCHSIPTVFTISANASVPSSPRRWRSTGTTRKRCISAFRPLDDDGAIVAIEKQAQKRLPPPLAM